MLTPTWLQESREVSFTRHLIMMHSHNALLRDGHVARIHRNQTLKAASVKKKKTR